MALYGVVIGGPVVTLGLGPKGFVAYVAYRAATTLLAERDDLSAAEAKIVTDLALEALEQLSDALAASETETIGLDGIVDPDTSLEGTEDDGTDLSGLLDSGG